MIPVGEYAQAIAYLIEAERLVAQNPALGPPFWTLVGQALCWLRLDRWDELLQKLTKNGRTLKNAIPANNSVGHTVWKSLSPRPAWPCRAILTKPESCANKPMTLWCKVLGGRPKAGDEPIIIECACH